MSLYTKENILLPAVSCNHLEEHKMTTKQKYLAIIASIVILLIGAIYWYSSQAPKTLPPMTVAEKKARFKSLLLPAANAVYQELTEQYKTATELVKTEPDSNKLVALQEYYGVDNNQALLTALKPHPISITLAQAAMESSWATSRFFLEANNVFGVWSFNENEPRIAAGQQRGDKTIWLKKYSSIEDAVRDYYRILAKGGAYKAFRAQKMLDNDPFILATKLDKYSEKGALYGEELIAIMKFNKLTEFDK